MKRILVLTPRFPFPVIGGDKLRIFKIIEKLSEKHRITLLSLCEDDHDLYYEIPKDIISDVKRVRLPKVKSYLNSFKSLFGNKPLQLGYFWSPTFQKIVKEELPNHDIVLAHLLRTAQYIPDSSQITTVLEMTDAISLNYERIQDLKGKSLIQYIYSLERKRVMDFEQEAISKFDKTIVVSPKDRDHLIKYSVSRENIKSKLKVYGNGVDFKNFPIVDTKGKNKIAFLGNMNASHNIDACHYFVKHLLPLINSMNRSIQFKVIGIGRESTLKKFSKYENVSVTGKVDDVGKELQDCFCGVCILRHGAGLQNKVLEYMAAGLPVLANKYGAEGTKTIEDKNILLAKKDEEVSKKILKLYESEELRKRVAKNALQYIKTYHQWESILDDYESSVISC